MQSRLGWLSTDGSHKDNYREFSRFCQLSSPNVDFFQIIDF
jgi:hypothetical protein